MSIIKEHFVLGNNENPEHAKHGLLQEFGHGTKNCPFSEQSN